MQHKETVAIIGATKVTGAMIAKRMAFANYRLLLMGMDAAALNVLHRNILKSIATATVEVNDCCKNASWQADIIIVAVDAIEQVTMAKKIKEVATQKIVVFINDKRDAGVELQKILPHSKLAFIFMQAADTDNTKLPIEIKGFDDDAINTAVEMMEIIGFKTIVNRELLKT